MNEDDFKEKINEIYDSRENILQYGGTVSSIHLKKALNLLAKLEDLKHFGHYEKMKFYLNEIVQNYRDALVKYNNQELKITEYNTQTGEEIH